jgi:hypothetical protein
MTVGHIRSADTVAAFEILVDHAEIVAVVARADVVVVFSEYSGRFSCSWLLYWLPCNVAEALGFNVYCCICCLARLLARFVNFSVFRPLSSCLPFDALCPISPHLYHLNDLPSLTHPSLFGLVFDSVTDHKPLCACAI